VLTVLADGLPTAEATNHGGFFLFQSPRTHRMDVHIRMLRDRVLIKPMERNRSNIISVIDSTERPNLGTVQAKGPLCDELEVGQTVRYGEFSFPKYRIAGEDFLVLQQADIAAIVEDQHA
jgi:co-chaperonin GroES (HSP10)